MKPPTWLTRPQPNAPIPKARQRYLWPVQVVTTALLAGTPALVFHLAGGHLSWPLTESSREPAALAAITLLGMLLLGALVEFEARFCENVHANEWYKQHHPELEPDPQVAQIAQYVQNILLTHGPLDLMTLHYHLARGGDSWPATKCSGAALRQRILMPGGKLAPWLAERDLREPYAHVEWPFKPEPIPADLHE